jgi:hypothetical protein
MIITGKVFSIDDKGKDTKNTIGLPFATIYEKGKMTNFKTADDRGQFNLNIDKGKIFIIRSVGFKPGEFTATSTMPTAFYLDRDKQTNLDEVIIKTTKPKKQTSTQPTNKALYLILGLLALLLLATKKK